jgi:hypothetical protein
MRDSHASGPLLEAALARHWSDIGLVARFFAQTDALYPHLIAALAEAAGRPLDPLRPELEPLREHLRLTSVRVPVIERLSRMPIEWI